MWLYWPKYCTWCPRIYIVQFCFKKNKKNLKKDQGHEIYKKLKNELVKKIKFWLQSQFTLEEEDQKPIDFNGETITFTSQQIKFYRFCCILPSFSS